jgi:hypothetical protein
VAGHIDVRLNHLTTYPFLEPRPYGTVLLPIFLMTPARYLFIFLITIICYGTSAAQGRDTSIMAGPEYHRSKIHQWLFGTNWRREWLTPVRFPVSLLDTLKGGLVPYQRSGGGESRSLRLRSSDGKEWVLRSVNKSRKALLPKFIRRTFYGTLVQDAVSMSHPYAALALPVMMQEALILHTKPSLHFVPHQKALDTFNSLYAGKIYLLEERPAGNWSAAPHLGGYTQYLSTIQVRDTLYKNNQLKADQRSFIKARLFDILISDVDRHEGNWRWGVTDKDSLNFIPIPGDRDQALFTFDGWLSKLSIALTRRRFMQNFAHRIKKVKTLTSHDQTLDHFFANSLTRKDWLDAASYLQSTLTDDVITRSVQGLPTEVYAVSGTEIIQKLKKRRDDLQEYAADYYLTLSKKVEVWGTSGNEHFIARGLPGDQLLIAVYSLDAKGQRGDKPIYHRIFHKNETQRITLYGMSKSDTFDIQKSRSIKVVTK